MIKHCRHCGREFKTKHELKFYCSKRCRKIERDKRHEEHLRIKYGKAATT